jgi:hypothetical protein
VFSGKTRPPEAIESLDALRKALESDSHAIAYTDSKNLTQSVRVVFSLPGSVQK